MGTRIARIGFALYSMVTSLELGLLIWQRQLLDGIGHRDTHALTARLTLFSYGTYALAVAALIALLLIAQLPPLVRARRPIYASLALTVLGIAVGVAQRFVLDSHSISYEAMSRLIHGIGIFMLLTYSASDVLLLVAGLRVARALSSPWLRALALAAMVSRVVGAVVALVPITSAATLLWWAHRAPSLLIAIVCALAAALVTRLPDVETPRQPDADGKLSPAWRAPADGIGLYLGGAAARVLFALVGYAVMASAHSANLGELRDLRGQVLLVALLSASASLAMLIALWRLSRAPIESRASGPALVALALGCIGLAIDGWSTALTVDALGGDLSAAFLAMKALPVVAVVSMLLGLGLAIALLRALENLATALGCPELASRARGAMVFTVGAGVLLGLAIAAVSARGGTEIALVLGVMGLPLAIVAVVQLVRSAIGIAHVIRQRL
jgi:hypothetical protein